MFRRSNREKIRRHTKHNRQEIMASETCGCISCLATFPPADIIQWTDEVDRDHPEKEVDRTAICPHCGDAMIIGDRSGHEISRTFLEALRVR